MNEISEGRTIGKEKTAPRKRSDLFIDSGLVFLYSLFIMGCFFTLMRYRNNVMLLTVLSSVSLTSFCMSYILYDLKRTLKILFLASILGYILASIVIAFNVYYPKSYLPEISKTQQVAEYLTIFFGFITLVLVLSIVGTIAGGYFAEKRKW